MILRKLQFIAFLSAVLCSSSLYASEGVLSGHFQSEPVESGEQLFAALQFEIDLVDRALDHQIKRANRSTDTGRFVHSGAGSVTGVAPGESTAEFWRHMDALARERLELLEMEHRLLSGDVSSLTEQRGEFRCASPLRNLHSSGSTGESCATSGGGPSFVAGYVSVDRLTPRASLNVPARPGIGRNTDVRASLFLHSIRNGSISGSGDRNSLFHSRLLARILFADSRSSCPSIASFSSSFLAFLSGPLHTSGAHALIHFFRLRPSRAGSVSLPTRITTTGTLAHSLRLLSVPGRNGSAHLELIGVSL